MNDGMMMASQPQIMESLCVAVAGQGGDGSLTLVTLIARALADYGYHIYESRNVASRIKGGHAAAFLRAGVDPVPAQGHDLDLLIAFDVEAIEILGPRVVENGVIIFDSSSEPCPMGGLKTGVEIVDVPFGRYAVRELRRDLYKNSLGYAVTCAILGLKDDLVQAKMREVYGRLPANVIAANLAAMETGFQIAGDFGYRGGRSRWQPRTLNQTRKHHMTGNEALAFGFLAAGGRFFAGYPITPATDIMEWLEKYLPDLGGVVIQAEDELASINMALGAAMTGVRTMTASSGPGIALMTEGISQAGSAELPVVIVNCQRAGPSTGMPTKPEQSDIGLMTQGANGDFPRVVLCPATPGECFEAGRLATDIAEIAQIPVFVALDQVVAQDRASFTLPHMGSLTINRGKRLAGPKGPGGPEYRRYQLTDDGISPWTIPGTPEGMSLVTGNERNEWGHVDTGPENRRRMMDKRARKLETISAMLPTAVNWGDASSDIGIIGVGMERGVMRDLTSLLARQNKSAAFHSPRTLWPVLPETLEFIAGKSRVFVIEHNREGQLFRLLGGALASRSHMTNITRYDGRAFSPEDLFRRLHEEGADL